MSINQNFTKTLTVLIKSILLIYVLNWDMKLYTHDVRNKTQTFFIVVHQSPWTGYIIKAVYNWDGGGREGWTVCVCMKYSRHTTHRTYIHTYKHVTSSSTQYSTPFTDQQISTKTQPQW